MIHTTPACDKCNRFWSEIDKKVFMRTIATGDRVESIRIICAICQMWEEASLTHKNITFVELQESEYVD